MMNTTQPWKWLLSSSNDKIPVYDTAGDLGLTPSGGNDFIYSSRIYKID